MDELKELERQERLLRARIAKLKKERESICTHDKIAILYPSTESQTINGESIIWRVGINHIRAGINRQNTIVPIISGIEKSEVVAEIQNVIKGLKELYDLAVKNIEEVRKEER